MSTTISAVYERGAIHPKEMLTLPESSHIQIQILANELDKPNIQSEAFARTIQGLYRLLDNVEQEWGNDIIQQVFLILLQSDLRVLWQVSLPQHRILCALLELAVAPLRSEMLTRSHLQAFRFIFDTLQHPHISQDEINECHDRLLESRLSATFELNEETLESYLDEL